jgi:MoxR-like ATPase
VTVNGQTWPLPLPFFVLATQNPIEQEGTYPLPEAQLDRFFLQVNIGYPSEADERRIVEETTGAKAAVLDKVLNSEEVLRLQDIVRRVPASDSVVAMAVQLARLSRPLDHSGPEYVRKWVSWGAGPRASQSLVLGAKARAILDGRFAASPEDVRAIAKPILRHRVVLNFQAEADGVSPDQVIDKLLAQV